MKKQIQHFLLTPGIYLAFFTTFTIFSSELFAEPTEPKSLAEFTKTDNDWFDNTAIRYIKKDQEKIVGGKKAPDGQYPWQVSLGVAWINDPAKAHFCGGSIVNEEWIRTAAHCVKGLQNSQILVTSGTNKLDSGGKRTAVNLIISHKGYNNPKEHDNDIALIKLSDRLVFSQKTKAIALANINYPLNQGQNLYVSGWGATREGGSGVAELRHVLVPFVTNQRCNDPAAYHGDITDTMLCAGKVSGGEDSCQGDSGGPLVDSSSNPIQVGVVSWGEGCARSGRVGVYADGRLYKNWEQACINNPNSCLN